MNQEEGKKLNFWWVNQGQTHKQEKEGEYLWAPKQTKGGFSVAHHKSLLEAKRYDKVFVYSSGEINAIGIVVKEAEEHPKPEAISSGNWEKDGYLLSLKYYPLSQPIKKEEIPEDWRLKEKGPFDRNGNVKQGYFYSVSRKFVEQFQSEFNRILPMDLINELENESEIIEQLSELEQHSDKIQLTDVDLVEYIHSYITGKGFFYEKDEVINLFLSLKAKPFVILSGISGTGKTKIIQLFAESVGATEKNGQFKLIPVRPDWNDGSDLLGYVDIKGEFKEGPLTEVLKTANKNPDLPYFVLLDEMNLARVEYYFSDLLSIMESRRWENDKIVSSTILSKEVIGEDIIIPSNVYIIGTVNMDETTHPFSKKVLDRANTIEFNQVKLDHFSFFQTEEANKTYHLPNKHFRGEYLYLKDVYKQYPELVENATKELVQINEMLHPIRAQVGYRVRDEICFYLAYNDQGQLLSFDQAFDRCLVQKILPRLTGSDYILQIVLENLFTHCTNKKIQEEQIDFTEDIRLARYPKSAEKIIEMRRRLLDDGFTSFWISS